MDTLLLPKVSVIIVNYNYNDYLETAFESVAKQTYPNIETVIVDDRSTDGSVATIDKICASNEGVIAVKLTKNGGQSVASYNGLSASSGAYLVFLDADDQLLSQCVEAHIYAHLSSRTPVAFTTVDILNNVAGQDVNLSHAGFNAYVEGGGGRRRDAVRRIDESMPNSWFGQRSSPVTVDQLHFVLPPHVEPWVWSPASANCFRRDAVELLLKEPGLDRIRWGTDAFMIRPLSGLFGSILIDRPLMRYIIHTTNRFTKGAPLNGMRIFDTSATAADSRAFTRSGVERLMAAAAHFGPRYEEPSIFFTAMKTLCERGPGANPSEKPGEYFTQQLVANEQSLVAGFGKDVVADVLRKNTPITRRLLSKS